MIKELLPPILVRYLSSFFYGWTGNYSSWESALKKCSGYDSQVILEKVKNAVTKVKNGEVAFERDSVLFDKVHYSFPLMSSLAIIALNRKEELKVLDFGGSLGSSYFQNIKIFKNLNAISWNVIEQNHFVEEGRKNFENDHLRFYHTIDECLMKQSVNTILLGSVLQYIEKPWVLLDQLISKRIEFIIIDRTPVFINKNDRITIQKVPKSIYKADYPCWILNEKKLIKKIVDGGYEMIYDSESHENINLKDGQLKGYFFKLVE